MKEVKKTKEEYNDVPLFYCKRCLSLAILRIDDLEGIDYCKKCGGTEVGVSLLDTWEQMYKDMYGKKLIKQKNLENYGR